MKRPIADRRRDLLVLRGYDREELAKLPLLTHEECCKIVVVKRSRVSRTI